MEEENIRIVTGIFEAFGRGDIPAVLAALSEDVEWEITAPPKAPYGGPRRGRAEVGESFQQLAATHEFLDLALQQFVAQGDTVVVLGRERLRARATGKTAENPWAMVFTLRDGQVVRLRTYEDTAAVAAALSP
jgi:ketosteroid isomerase-like protein